MSDVKGITAPETLAASIARQSEELAVKLRDAGLKVEAYKKAPVAPEIFNLSMHSKGLIKIWVGQATIDFHTDSKLRQAVINAKENRREITRTYRADTYRVDDPVAMTMRRLPDDPASKEVVPTFISRVARDTFPVFVPNGKVVIKELKDLGVRTSRAGRERHVRVTASVTAPAATNSFLIGYDENRQFISVLPRRANSVASAHKALRPAGIPQDALRQGEWFFVPVTTNEQAEIDEALAGRQKAHMPITVQRLERNSDHQVQSFVVNNVRYAIGLVFDNRPDHHKPLVLPKWHKVVRNSEIAAPQNVATTRRSYD